MGRRTLTGPLELQEAAIRVGEHTISRDEVSRGFFDPGPPSQVVLLTREGEVGLDITDFARARSVLEVLGVDVEHRAMHFEALPAMTRFWYVVGVFLVGGAAAAAIGNTFGRVPAPVLLAILLTTLYFAVKVARGKGIDVGADGVRYAKRFIPLADIRSVKPEIGACTMGHKDCWDAKVVLDLAGEDVTIQFPYSDAKAPEQARVVAERIQEALTAHGPRTAESSILDAEVDDIATWRERLIALAGKRASYRGEGLEPLEVTRALEDTFAPPRRRLAAAIALHASGAEDGPSRIRVCAEATVEPHFRVALERIAEGNADDEVIERALRVE